jgi:Zn finger protein HypA/HybF involved in hydrogenase expression
MGMPTLSPGEVQMTEKAGETARESANYRCERCRQITVLPKGALIPACPFCGHHTYDLANPRFERRDGSLGPHEPD